MNHVIAKIQIISGIIDISPIGYVTSQEDADQVNSTYYSDMSNWIDLNMDNLENGEINLEDYFYINSPAYRVEWSTNIIGIDIPLISNINDIGDM